MERMMMRMCLRQRHSKRSVSLLSSRHSCLGGLKQLAPGAAVSPI